MKACISSGEDGAPAASPSTSYTDQKTVLIHPNSNDPARRSRFDLLTNGRSPIRTPSPKNLSNVPAHVYAASMNRIDRLYALVEELRAAGPRGRTARQLAVHFEVKR
jgi:hypothetical protein